MGSNVTRLPTASKRKVRNRGVAIADAGNVTIAQIVSRVDIPPERVLHQASTEGLRDVVVIGFDADGDFYFCGSMADGANVLWLLEKARTALMEMG